MGKTKRQPPRKTKKRLYKDVVEEVLQQKLTPAKGRTYRPEYTPLFSGQPSNILVF